MRFFYAVSLKSLPTKSEYYVQKMSLTRGCMKKRTAEEAYSVIFDNSITVCGQDLHLQLRSSSEHPGHSIGQTDVSVVRMKAGKGWDTEMIKTQLEETVKEEGRKPEYVVYVGPMGCLTGMYIIMQGTYTVEDMRQLTIECLEWMLTQTEVPATRPEACGNYLLHDLPMCKWESRRYLDRLLHDFHSEYTKLQITLDDGRVFADA